MAYQPQFVGDQAMQRRIRIGILALPASGLLGTISVLPPGVFINPSVDPEGFAQASGTNGLGNMIGIVSLVLLLVGVQALYSLLAGTSADKWALAGMITTFLGVGLFLPFAGIFAFATPVAGRLYLNGDKAAISVIASSVAVSNPYALLFASTSALLSMSGSIFFGIAIWKWRRVPRYSGILYSSAILSSFLSAPLYSFILGFLGGVLLLASGGWIAFGVTRRADSE